MIFIDFEVFAHDWLCVAYDTDTRERVEIVNNPSEMAGYYLWHAEDVWCGYNIRGYDQYILKAVILLMDPKEVNDAIIVHGRRGWQIAKEFNSIPLRFFDCYQNIDRGLKYFEGSMGNDIRETTVPFDIDRKLTGEELEEVLRYCRHDVEQTIEVFLHRKADFSAQMDLLKLYGLPLIDLGKTKPQLSAKILEAVRFEAFDDFDIDIPENLTLERYGHVASWYRDGMHFESYDAQLNAEVAGVPHVFGWGGVHGARERYHGKGYFINVDVASLYPALIIRYGLMSRAVDDPRKYEEIRDLRLKLKAEGDPRQAALKIVLNSTYGAMKDRTNALYDPRQANRVCVHGQLLLLDLIERLEDAGAEIIQSNTDGVLVKKPKDGTLDGWFFSRVDDACYEWEQRTGLKLEFDEFAEVWQKDVNNYVFKRADGSYKSKGAWVKKQDALSRDLPIVAKALVARMVDGVPIKRTINGCDSLEEFQMVCRLSSKYRTFVHGAEVLNERTCRVFASNDWADAGLGKIHSGNGRECKVAGTPAHCRVVNEAVHGMAVPEWLDRGWYIELAEERMRGFAE